MSEKPEIIVCSAIHFYIDGFPQTHRPSNVDWGLVVCGIGHHVCFEISGLINVNLKSGYCDGFLTNKNRFVGREEAFTIATAAGQIHTKHGSDGYLFSEDVFY